MILIDAICIELKRFFLIFKAQYRFGCCVHRLVRCLRRKIVLQIFKSILALLPSFNRCKLTNLHSLFDWWTNLVFYYIYSFRWATPFLLNDPINYYYVNYQLCIPQCHIFRFFINNIRLIRINKFEIQVSRQLLCIWNRTQSNRFTIIARFVTRVKIIS